LATLLLEERELLAELLAFLLLLLPPPSLLLVLLDARVALKGQRPKAIRRDRTVGGAVNKFGCECS
jgi:hypothetical protein